MLTLRQSWGASPGGGMDALLGRETLAANDDDAEGGGAGFETAGRLEGEVGYGFAVFGGGFTGTPYAGFGLGGGRDYRLGWRLTSAIPGDPGFELGLEAARREAANDGEAPEHALMLRGAVRW